MSKNASRNNRRGGDKHTSKVIRGEQQIMEDRKIKEKFRDIKHSKVFNIQPLNHSQVRYLELLKTKQLVISLGASGAGKTWMACTHAVNEYLKGNVDGIVLIRPYEFVGRSVGLRPGSNFEKLLPIMQSMIDPIKQVLGEAEFDYAVQHGKIVLESLEDCRGRSYKKKFVIVDEASNTDIKAMQTLVTRIDEGSRMVFCGDSAEWQKDIRGESGLVWIDKLITRLKRDKPWYLDQEDNDELYNNIGVVTFGREDVVRSGLAKLFVKVFDEERLG